jgi:uncharacterized membrane protein
MKSFSVRSDWPSYFAIGISIIVGIIVYPRLPDRIPVHFNIEGQVDNYADKSIFSVFFLPMISIGTYLLMGLLPKIDPRKANYDDFQTSYCLIRNAIIFFLSALSLFITAYSLGYAIAIDRLVVAGVGATFVVIGNVLGKIKPNYFVGIRLPWTLHNDEVWRLVHRFSARIFVAEGFILILSTIVSGPSRLFILVSCIPGGLAAIVLYAYRTHSRITRT